MRSLPAILLAFLTVVAIAVSAVLTASHFGMRDWPTPPMPDTATRLITPTAKARERLTKGSDAQEVTIGGDAGAAARPERAAAAPATRRAESSSRRSARRGG